MINPTQNRLTFYFIALTFMVVAYLLMKRIVSSPTGRVIQATRENEDRSRMIGYNPVTYRTLAFVIAFVFAGVAGGLYSLWTTSATPSMTSSVDDSKCAHHDVFWRDGHLDWSDFRGWDHADFQPIFVYLVWRSLALGLWNHICINCDVPSIWNRWHLALAGFQLKQGWQRLLGMLKSKD